MASSLNGHEFEKALEDGEGQGSLACYSPWGCKEADMTEQLNNNKYEILTCTYMVASGSFSSIEGLKHEIFLFKIFVLPITINTFVNYNI